MNKKMQRLIQGIFDSWGRYFKEIHRREIPLSGGMVWVCDKRTGEIYIYGLSLRDVKREIGHLTDKDLDKGEDW